MARRPTLSTTTGEQVYVEEIKDYFTLLDVVYANQFEGENIDPDMIKQTEKNFYRGAPPKWLNFHISEQTNPKGTGLIKREGYDRLVHQIQKRRNGPGTSTVLLFHQHGCGGTTLAMQVLWDLRKTFRCAALTGPVLEVKKVAKEVVHLFTGGGEFELNTVLLLLNDEVLLEYLQDSIMAEIAELELDLEVPVVILFNCIRSDHAVVKKQHALEQTEINSPNTEDVILKKSLSDKEQTLFSDKREELERIHGDQVQFFFGFNILQSNFSEEYVQEVCAVFQKKKRKNKPLKTQLVSFFSLLNAYVPGSYLLESECLEFLGHDADITEDLSLPDLMQPFSHLILSLQSGKGREKKVQMAHPMIAKCCTGLLADSGVARSDTTRNFLNRFCSDDVSPSLLYFIKDLLTKREKKYDERHKELYLEKFSPLILHISDIENKRQSASVLKVASKRFTENSVFPQALARLYYGELKDYEEAEVWAKKAKERDPNKSFIADTLGQVHKNHLMDSRFCHKARQLLHLAQKAIDAFEEEERLADKEHRKSSTEVEKSTGLRDLNIRGQFGFLQVCSLLFDRLVSQNEEWRQVLTNDVALGSVLESLGDAKLQRYNNLMKSLRQRVEEKCEFFDNFLTYSESVLKKDKGYVSTEVAACYKKYVGNSTLKNRGVRQEMFQKLKEKMAFTSAGVLSCLDKRCTRSDIQCITECWEKICQRGGSTTDFVNLVLSKIMLSNKISTSPAADYKNALKQTQAQSCAARTEYHMLALLLFWPSEDEDRPVTDLGQLIENVKLAFKREYQKTLQPRYLRPLFFLGPGKGLTRFVHRRVIEIVWTKDALLDSKTNWKNENVFKDSAVEGYVHKVDGVVQNYKVYATFRDTRVEVEANRKDSLWRSGKVSFYLGFTIRGPVAFCIQRRLPMMEGKKDLDGSENNSGDWMKVDPEVQMVDGIQTHSLRSGRGSFECQVSALRWVCKEPISFQYQFGSWEELKERSAGLEYMPAGPLMDISVTSGSIEEVYLPHWIDTTSAGSHMFAVLHVDSCGDSVEKVSEVTSSHVKLLQPTFSPKGVMLWMKLGLPVKVYHDIMIFKTTLEFLTLHVYLVPPDRYVKQTVEREESFSGSVIIPKPSPDKSLQMLDYFYLTTNADEVKVNPEKIKLRSERRTYFEVFVRNAQSDFQLKLMTGNPNTDSVWTCDIRTDEHFVDLHRTALINRVKDTKHLLDKLLDLKLISKENYSFIRVTETEQEQMRDILKIVTSAGRKGKDAFHKILKGMKNLRPLLSELEEGQE